MNSVGRGHKPYLGWERKQGREELAFFKEVLQKKKAGQEKTISRKRGVGNKDVGTIRSLRSRKGQERKGSNPKIKKKNIAAEYLGGG